VRFRRALALAIDADAIIAHLLRGHAVRAAGLLSPVNRFYEGRVAVYPHDPEKARAILAELGEAASVGESGGKPGASLQLKTNNNAQAIGIARVLQAQLASVGIRLDIRSFEWGTFYGDVKAGNFQAASMRWVGIVEPDFFYDVFHSSRIPPNGNNRGRYRSEEMDKLLEAGRTTTEFAQRKAIYSEVQKEAAEDLPYISLWHVNNISIVHRRVRGYRQHPTGGFLSLRDVALD
jgi:peptide/nickel transport system substrate-binding protein